MDQDSPTSQQISPESNRAYLREHLARLRQADLSFDFSEMSFHTEQTDFPNSRHSSLNTEPLTLDADEMHTAKDKAVDVLQNSDADAASELFTKDLEGKPREKLSQDGDETQAEAPSQRTVQDLEGKLCEKFSQDGDETQAEAPSQLTVQDLEGKPCEKLSQDGDETQAEAPSQRTVQDLEGKPCEKLSQDGDETQAEAPSQGTDTEVLIQQINALVDKAQQVEEANHTHSQAIGKVSELMKDLAAQSQIAGQGMLAPGTSSSAKPALIVEIPDTNAASSEAGEKKLD